ncbi:hypothetical protein [Haloglomus litoreum]|uniref:hypothetical protein n=1 Tax=Haloglomus litoreum TaxID=3034026 RepID=UPI0023E888D7|nr:hypothetical protein [Haloglomus sp. DT116]
MSDPDSRSLWLRLTIGVALVVFGSPFLLGPVAPVAVLFLVLALYALVAERSRPSQRWKAPAAAVGALAATVTVELLAGELLPSGLDAVAAPVGGAATAVGLLLAVRSARAL